MHVEKEMDKKVLAAFSGTDKATDWIISVSLPSYLPSKGGWSLLGLNQLMD